MIIDELRSLMHARPFKPFTIVTADGSEILVHHHDYAWVLPSGHEIHVEQRDERVDLVSVSQITKIKYQHQSGSAEPSGSVPRG